MIAKDTTTTVNFFVTDTDGLPSTGQASNITATISINGATATAISDTISEKGSGWYYFNHAFSTAGNAFIEFTATNCVIMPWEDEVVEISASSAPSAATIASAVWNWTVTGIPSQNSMYSKVNTLPGSVWANSTRSLTSEVLSADKSLATNISASAIATAVWSDTTNYSSASTKGYLQANGSGVWSQVAIHDSITGTDTTYGEVLKSRASSANITSAKTAIINAMPDVSGLSTFDPSNDTVTINATQAATMTTATGFATPSNITAAQTAIINAMPDVSGLSTFDPVNDTVLIDSAQAATMVTATGFASPSDISSAQSAIITAMPDISGLSTFDPANDTVLIDSTQAAGMTTATGFATPVDVTAAQTAIINAMPDVSGLSTFDAANDTVTINSTQAATMTTATGFATPTNVTDAVSALETYGDAHWTGGGSGGGGITAEDVWKYSGTYGRSLTVSPTDISSLATKTDLTTAQTAIVNAMPSTAGLATATNVSDAKADIIAAIPDISGLSTFNAATDTVVIDSTQAATMTTATGFATPANITDAQTAIINAMPDVSGLSTFDPSTDTVILASAQTDAIASSVWSDTTIYTGNSKGNRLSGIYNTVQNIPGQVWMVDADYGATIQGTMGQAIYNMFNDHATATDVSVVADLLEQIDAGVLHWSTTATRLTLYKEDNSVLRVYALERDADGNITRINPVA